MPLFQQLCRGLGLPVAGSLLLVAMAVPRSLEGAKVTGGSVADVYSRASLLHEDLRAVPAYELGAKQYQLVVDAFEKVRAKGPTRAHWGESLLKIGQLYREMERKFEKPAYREKALDALRELASGTASETALGTLRGQAIQTIRDMGGRVPAAVAGDSAKDASDGPTLVKAPSAGGAKRAGVVSIRRIRHWSHPDYTRVVIELDARIDFRHDRIPRPERIYFDFIGSRLGRSMGRGSTTEVNDPLLKSIRVGQNRRNVARVVLDLESRVYSSSSWLSNPARLVVELRSKPRELIAAERKPAGKPEPPLLASVASYPVTHADGRMAPRSFAESLAGGLRIEDPASRVTETLPAEHSPGIAMPVVRSEGMDPPSSEVADSEGAPVPPARVIERYRPRPTNLEAPSETAALALHGPAIDAIGGAPEVGAVTLAGLPYGFEPGTIRPPVEPPPAEPVLTAKLEPPPLPHEILRDPKPSPLRKLDPPRAAKATSLGKRSLIRALGLKLGRVVIDAGHGGHDTGTVGRGGLREKDLVNDIAQILGRLIEERLGSEVIYTRTDDRFVGLRERTRFANVRKADLFLSIHANSARQRNVNGIETYYLNFTTDSWAMAVAARENAASERSIHELRDLVSKIALQEKIDESRELAAKVQSALYRGLSKHTKGLRNRGVRKAPLMVLIGAEMPAVLVEIGFLSNLANEKRLKTSAYRQKIAQNLYKGIAAYAETLSATPMQLSQQGLGSGK